MNKVFIKILFYLSPAFLCACTKDGDNDPSVSKGKWETVKDFPGTPRYQSVSFVIGNMGYIGTGSYQLSDFYSYNAGTDSWAQIANIPVGRMEAVGFAINGKGYVLTGINGSSDFNDVWEYDPAADTWIQKKDFPGYPRYDAAGFAIGNKGYMGTGITNPTPDTQMQLSDWWEYDPSTDTWTQKKDFPGGPCNLTTAIAAGTKGFLGISGPGFNPGNQWWEYDPPADTWTRKADFPGKARYDAGGFSIDNACYVGNGGIGRGGGNPENFLYDWWKYDIASDKWFESSSQQQERYGGSGFAINGKGYFGLGHSDTNGEQKDFWRFEPQ